MAEAWGNPDDDKKNQDLVSSTSFNNVLKVNDVNNANDAKIAAHFINSSTNANARALKAEGMVKIVAFSDNDPKTTGLKIENVSLGDDAKVATLIGGGNVAVDIDGAMRRYIDVLGWH